MKIIDFRAKDALLYILFYTLLTGVLISVWDIQAAGLGKLTVGSYLGQPLEAEIALESVKDREIDSLSVRLASPEAFQKVGITFAPYHAALSVSVEKRTDGRPYIRVSSLQVVSEPFLNLLIELSWSSGHLLREYTVLLDPAETGRTASAVPVVQAHENTAPVDRSSVTPIQRNVRQPVAETAKNLPASRVGSVGQTVDTYGPVNRDDTLSRIARQVSPESVDLNQMLVALYRANRDAFIEKNMNLLKAGVILLIPDLDEISQITPREAVREVVVQGESWNDYRQKIADMAVSVPGRDGLKQSQTGKITVVPEESTIAGGARSEEVLRLSKGELLEGSQSPIGDTESNTAQQYLRMMEEDATAKERALQEANERVTTLEQNIARLQRLLELKGSAPETRDQVKSEQTLSGGPDPQPGTLVQSESIRSALEVSAPAVQALGNSGALDLTIPAQPVATGLPASTLQPPQLAESESDDFPLFDTLTDLAAKNVEWIGSVFAVLLTIGLGMSMLHRRKEQAEGSAETTDTETRDMYGYAEKEAEQLPASTTGSFLDDPETLIKADVELDQQTIFSAEQQDSIGVDDGKITNPGFFFGKKLDEDTSEGQIADTDSVDRASDKDTLSEKRDRNGGVSDYEIKFYTTGAESVQGESEKEIFIGAEPGARESVKGEDEQWDFTGLAHEDDSIRKDSQSQDDHEVQFDLSVPDGSDFSEKLRAADEMPEIGTIFTNIDLSLGDKPEVISEAGDERSEEGEAMRQREVVTKLDLAKAYLEMDDKEGARDILEEVLREGDSDQQSVARSMLDGMN